MDFVAVDFETANGFRGSPCAVGLVRVIGGRPDAEWESLVAPPAPADVFDPRNVRIHGILPEDVRDAPEFPAVLERILAFSEGLPLVAHNAAFDLGVLRGAAELTSSRLPRRRSACTVQMSRASFSLLSHSLPFSAEAAGHPMTHHHNALADARACAAIALEAIRRTGAETLEEALRRLGVPMSQLAPYDPAEGISSATERALSSVPGTSGEDGAPAESFELPSRLDPVSPNPDADPANPLFGQRVLFTGPLGLSRAEAWRRAAECGAEPVGVLSLSTSVLVVGGGFESDDVRGGGRFTSSTLEKALKLQARGFQLEIVTEGEFMQRVGGAWPPHGA